MTERAYKFRFYPTLEQENLLRRTIGCVRLVYNKALATRTEGWYERQERIGYDRTSSLLTEWKKQQDLQFLNEVSCVPLQQGLRHLQTAFTNFWAKRAKYPEFKKKRSGGHAEFTRSAFKWKEGRLWLAKCQEPLNLVWSRKLPDNCHPSTVTIKLDLSGRWFVSLLVDDRTVKPLAKTNKKIGIDAGVSSLITTSDGEKVGNPQHFQRSYRNLKKAQKALSRKTKGSINYYKASLQVAKIKAKIQDARTDFMHKLTTKLVRDNDRVVVEDLAVKNRVKNRKVACAISDASWSEFYRQLDYKCQWYGKELITIDRYFPSSKRCGNCGKIRGKMPLTVRQWECPSCGTVHDRDLNASKNILAAGLAVSAPVAHGGNPEDRAALSVERPLDLKGVNLGRQVRKPVRERSTNPNREV